MNFSVCDYQVPFFFFKYHNITFKMQQYFFFFGKIGINKYYYNIIMYIICLGSTYNKILGAVPMKIAADL